MLGVPPPGAGRRREHTGGHLSRQQRMPIAQPLSGMLFERLATRFLPRVARGGGALEGALGLNLVARHSRLSRPFRRPHSLRRLPARRPPLLRFARDGRHFAVICFCPLPSQDLCLVACGQADHLVCCRPQARAHEGLQLPYRGFRGLGALAQQEWRLC